jgi:hypothetical protein
MCFGTYLFRKMTLIVTTLFFYAVFTLVIVVSFIYLLACLLVIITRDDMSTIDVHSYTSSAQCLPAISSLISFLQLMASPSSNTSNHFD